MLAAGTPVSLWSASRAAAALTGIVAYWHRRAWPLGILGQQRHAGNAASVLSSRLKPGQALKRRLT